MSGSTEQSELLCPACGGQCRFDPASSGLLCLSCGTGHRLESPWDSTAQAEFPYRHDMQDNPDHRAPALPDSRAFHCDTCGGDVVFTGPALSTNCPYCDGPVVLSAQDEGYRAMALIPFRVPERDAQANVIAWVRKRFCAPGDLSAVVQEGRVAGLYAPFWTFDSDEAVRYWASYRTGSGKNKRRRSVRGRMKIRFDDMLMPASPHVTPLIRDGILHDFDPRRLRPYRAGYLAGFAAERHRQSVTQGLAANEADKALLIRNRIKGHVNKPSTRVSRYESDTTGIKYRRILLPVWILHYRYGDVPMKVVVSGIDGRTFGERPFSQGKLAICAALLSALVIAFGFAWGASGAP